LPDDLQGTEGIYMRTPALLAVAFAAYALTGCARFAEQAAVKNATTCAQEVNATPEAQLVFARLWAGNTSDTAAKLSDPKPLTPRERDALVVVHNKIQPCRQIVITSDNNYAAWETPYWQEYFQRSDEIFYKLASGDLPVGIANKLQIESTGKFQVDVSRGHADAVRVEEVQRQQAAQALLQASAQIAASQPRTTTTNCNWFGNTLNCTSTR
jgi:hypothetical protein